MPQGTLNGYALAMLTGTDHTYVTSSDGYTWPCFGRSQGGSLICSGVGNTAKANCLSNPGGRFAGIIYGITGVCHQAANRVLYPSGQTVSRARGYMASFALYGTYGRRSWPELAVCNASHVHP